MTTRLPLRLVASSPQTADKLTHDLRTNGWDVEPAAGWLDVLESSLGPAASPAILVLVPEAQDMRDALRLVRILKAEALPLPAVWISEPEQVPGALHRSGIDAVLSITTDWQTTVTLLNEQLGVVSQLYADDSQAAGLRGLTADCGLQTDIETSLEQRLTNRLDAVLSRLELVRACQRLRPMSGDETLVRYLASNALDEILGYDAMALYLAPPEGAPPSAPRLTFHLASGPVAPATLEAMAEGFGRSLVETGLMSEAPVNPEIDTLGSSTSAEARAAAPSVVYGATLVRPLRLHHDTPLGLMVLYYQNDDPARLPDAQSLALAESELATLAQLNRFERRTGLLTHLDAPTGLYTHSYLRQVLEKELQRAGRYELDLSVAAISIRNLRQINEQEGYLMGDAAIRQMADTLREALRTVDVIARTGSGRFVVVFPETNRHQGQVACERIFKALQRSEVRWKDRHVALELSVALVGTPVPESVLSAASAHSWLEAVFEALRRADSHPPNSLVVWDVDTPWPSLDNNQPDAGVAQR